MVLRRLGCLLVAGVCLAGCTLAQYRRQADRVAVGAISSAQKAALGEARTFQVVYHPFAVEGGQAIRVGNKVIPLVESAGAPAVLGVDECLEIAFRNSRPFQDRRETLYTLALSVANTRREWNWSKAGGTIASDTEISRVDKGDTTKSATANGDVTFSQKLLDGGAIALGASVNFASDLLGWKSSTLGSLLEAKFTQPLLQGAWRGLAYETQYRQERDLLLSVFDYQRYTQTFAADVYRQYFAVVRQRDQLENDRTNVRRLEDTFRMTEVQAKGGQVSSVQADQAEQELLSARVRLEQSQQSYEDRLDTFKLLLGLPMQARIEVAYPDSLTLLEREGLRDLPFVEAEAIIVAMMARPDVLQRRAAARDAHRDVEVAADKFLPQLDVELGISAPSDPLHPREFHAIRFDETTRTATLNLDYDLDQTDHRDAYRNAILKDEKAQRDLAEFLDRVRLEVRQAYRELVQSRESYRLQVRNVQVAERRQKLAALEQRQGLASARDVLEAEEGLRQAQNGRTQALVSYRTTRLTFLATLGMLDVNDYGRIQERTEPFRFDRLARRYSYLGGAAQ